MRGGVQDWIFPERINPGDDAHELSKITKIIAGMDDETLDDLANLYDKVTTVYRAKSIQVAESAKVIENIQRDLNIALMNELTIIFHGWHQYRRCPGSLQERNGILCHFARVLSAGIVFLLIHITLLPVRRNTGTSPGNSCWPCNQRFYAEVCCGYDRQGIKYRWEGS